MQFFTAHDQFVQEISGFYRIIFVWGIIAEGRVEKIRAGSDYGRIRGTDASEHNLSFFRAHGPQNNPGPKGFTTFLHLIGPD